MLFEPDCPNIALDYLLCVMYIQPCPCFGEFIILLYVTFDSNIKGF